ncbi:MAG: hypothetical protein EA397_09260 [Deltaproteobacteria bacterium]|nr:MAG: hypothetical protein EA397_09260 [Deltaproteobacteria bacterium]
MIRRWSVIGLTLAALCLVAANPRRAYLRDVDQATEELKIYRGFDTALILRGTLLDRPMRTALAEERKRLINPNDQNHSAFLERMSDDYERFHDIVFSASSPMPNARTFGESDAGWVLWLEADGTREEMVSVERVRRPSPLHQELYPHLNVWSKLWIARFAKTVKEPEEVVLHIGSGFGNGELRWKRRK